MSDNTIIAASKPLFGDFIYSDTKIFQVESDDSNSDYSSDNESDVASSVTSYAEESDSSIDVKELDQCIPFKALSMRYSPNIVIDAIRADEAADAIPVPSPQSTEVVHIWDLDGDYNAQYLASGARFEAKMRSCKVKHEAKARAIQVSKLPKLPPRVSPLGPSALEVKLNTSRARRSPLRECAYIGNSESFVEVLVHCERSPVTITLEFDFSDAQDVEEESSASLDDCEELSEEVDWTPYYSRNTLAVPSPFDIAQLFAQKPDFVEEMTGSEVVDADEDADLDVDVESALDSHSVCDGWVEEEEEEELESLEDLNSWFATRS